MIYVLSFVLSSWLLLFIFAVYCLIKNLFLSFKETKHETSLQKRVLKQAVELLNSDKEIFALVKDIYLLNSHPDSEACKMRSAILQGKLKTLVKNPVLRTSLFDAIKKIK